MRQPHVSKLVPSLSWACCFNAQPLYTSVAGLFLASAVSPPLPLGDVSIERRLLRCRLTAAAVYLLRACPILLSRAAASSPVPPRVV